MLINSNNIKIEIFENFCILKCMVGSRVDFGMSFFFDLESILILGWIKKFPWKSLKNPVWKILGIGIYFLGFFKFGISQRFVSSEPGFFLWDGITRQKATSEKKSYCKALKMCPKKKLKWYFGIRWSENHMTNFVFFYFEPIIVNIRPIFGLIIMNLTLKIFEHIVSYIFQIEIVNSQSKIQTFSDTSFYSFISFQINSLFNS